MPVGLAEEGAGEDSDVEDDAKRVKHTEAGNEMEKRGFKVQLCSQNHQECRNIA